MGQSSGLECLTGCGTCVAAMMMLACVAGIAVAGVGLAGGLSAHATSVATLTTNAAMTVFNVPGIVVSALGLQGVVSATVVSAVTIGVNSAMLVIIPVIGCGLCVCKKLSDAPWFNP